MPDDNLPAVPPKHEGDLPALPMDNEWAELADFDDGIARYVDQFGLSMPRLRTDFGRNGRGFIDDLSGEIRRELNLVILATPPSRSFWLKEEPDGSPPDCTSTDLLRGTPDANSPAVQAEFCAACPHSQWTTDDEGRRRHPRCQEATNVFAHDVDSDGFAWVRFKSTALKPFNRYTSSLVMRKRPLYSVVTKVGLEEAKRDSLEWLVPTFTIASELTPDSVKPWRDMAKRAMESWAQVATEMASTDAATQSGPFDEPGTAARTVYAEGEEPF